MYINRYIAFLTACAMSASLLSCSSVKQSSSSDTASEISSYEEISSVSLEELTADIPPEYMSVAKVKDSDRLSDIREHISQLFAHLDSSGSDEAIKNDIDTLLKDFDVIYEYSAEKRIPYYLDWDNTELEDEFDDAYEDANIAAALLEFAFGQGWLSDEYSYLFEDLHDPDEEIETDDDLDTALIRHEINSRVENAESDSLLDEYHDILFDEDMSDDEKNLRCAELYLDILSDYDADTLYSLFNRDYTGEEITELSGIIREKFSPLLEKAYYSFLSAGAYDIVMYPKEFDDVFKVIQQYAPRLSEDISKTADDLVKDKRYYIAKGDSCYNGSFTDFLPASRRAYIYIHTDELSSYDDLLTAVHEFGHYYAYSYDNIPYFVGADNIDIAEVQSQGFEFLFTQFYDEIYAEQAEGMHRIKLHDMLYAVMTGFMVGEFEFTVLKNKDTFTPQDVVKCWEELTGSLYLGGAELYEINHIYEQPGYYISYGVSALAAFDIWQDCLYDPDEALRKYENIARISCNDKNYQFRSALDKAGFNDVLNKDYINTLSEEIMDHINGLT